jgi:hypothetical protein
MLLRFAKIAGGLRAVVTEAGPIIATSVGLLSARSAAYLVGFALGSIVSSWLPILALLISVAGFFNAGSSTAECEAYRAQMRLIDEANRALAASYQIASKPYVTAYIAWNERYMDALRAGYAKYKDACTAICEADVGDHDSAGSLCFYCMRSTRDKIYDEALQSVGSRPQPPPFPNYQTYPACSSPNCPPGKMVWTQVLWASPTGNFTDPKGCFIVAFSQDAPTLAPKIEYNPFLPKTYVETRPISYYLVKGDMYRGLKDDTWNNLESVEGWDKGYWRSEQTDLECRGWRPGWSKIVK